MATPTNTTTTMTTSNFLTIKLDHTNYSLWLAQITPLLKSRNLMGFVDGTKPCPPAFLRNDAGTFIDTVNPVYEEWIATDKMILGWINGSLTPSVLATVSRSVASHTTWTSLARRYASQNHNRILQLRSNLLRTTRGDLSISDYLDKINQLADSLALSGHPVDDSDLISIIMNNVGPLYENTINSAQARDTPITYDALEALLLGAESRLQNQALLGMESTPTALFTNNRQTAPLHTGGSQRGRPTNHGRGSFYGPTTYGRGSSSRFPSRGGSILGQAPSPRPTYDLRGPCQICNRNGHTAIDCFHRLNMAYEGRTPSTRLSAMAAATTSPHDPSPWLLDTGSNTHITNNPHTLTHPREYHGSDTVGGVVSGSELREDAFGGSE
ncbi:hypothetical protein ABKV19_025492 [Rosa sericea]